MFTYEYHILHKQGDKLMQTNEIITTEEASKILYVTPYTIREYIKKGMLKAKKLGKQYLISRKEVDNLLQELL